MKQLVQCRICFQPFEAKTRLQKVSRVCESCLWDDLPQKSIKLKGQDKNEKRSQKKESFKEEE